MSLAVDIATSALRLKGPQRSSRWLDHLISTFAMVLSAAALGALLAKLPPECDPETYWPEWPCSLPYVLIGGATFGLLFLPIALLILWSLRGERLGGYLPAALTGAILATVGGALIFENGMAASVFAVAGATLGALYWLALFLICRVRTP